MVPPVGRPPAHRSVHAFDGVLVPPSAVVLDTSFVAEALIPSQPRHFECRQFLQHLALAQSRVIFNRFLEAELWETAYRIALKELHPKKHANAVRRDGRTLRRAKTLHAQVEQAWQEVLTTLDWVAIDLQEMSYWIPVLMTYGLSSYDAIHAGTAVFADVRAFVTLDFDFACVPEQALELWVPQSRLRACRDRRR